MNKWQLMQLSIEQIVTKFKQIDLHKTLRIEQQYKTNEDNQYVNYIIVTFGQWQYLDGQKQIWHTLYVNKDGSFYDGSPTVQEIKQKDIYECFEYSYDWDIKPLLVELYMKIMQRIKRMVI